MSLAIGIDTGGTKLLAGVISEEGEIIQRHLEPVDKRSEETVIAQMLSVTEALRENYDIAAVGVGVPGTLLLPEGRVVQTVHLPLQNVPLRKILEDKLDSFVAIGNDVNCAVFAEERVGAAAGGKDDVVMLALGTGVGGGLIIDGQLYSGSSGAAPELGHMVVEADGPPCQGACPNRGCLETFASGTALARMAREGLEDNPDSLLADIEDEKLTGEAVFHAASAGDNYAIELFGRLGYYLGVGMANLCNIFNPECIVIGGGLIEANHFFLDKAKREMKQRALAPTDETEVVLASLGSDSGMIGAALLGLDLHMRMHQP